MLKLIALLRRPVFATLVPVALLASGPAPAVSPSNNICAVQCDFGASDTIYAGTLEQCTQYAFNLCGRPPNGGGSFTYNNQSYAW
ncbi:hypothetical protein [Pyxidicoccus caerfyrddinensis]|uniref:hypothetical protein n=1 Tax=Pyxidicoccus caerfyrddinensis TaxID=2709663 RepID=UPI0013DA455F|nr:hypothetical protein [Pyxidicoccus caerfyrddinensis]